ncbi:MAG: RsmB/NOP family class I SAM-dependent RNA methyltransferase, partial [Longimicrobiales bacterium]
DVLRLGGYQLFEMGSVPAYAAVSQAVEQAKAIGGRGAGSFVNGVLQSLRRAGPAEPWPSLEEDPVAHLSAWGSHPRWLVERWVERFGAADTAALVRANNQRPALYLRPVGVSVEEAAARLAGAGIQSERPDLGGFGAGVVARDVLEVLPPANVVDALAAVPAVVQDPAASLVTHAVAAPPGGVVADLCAAPGGKTMGVAGDVTDAFVVAADLTPMRLVRLRENLERTGLSNVRVIVADARRPPLGRADVVLIDAPCTGTGTLRRHPDGRWRLTPDDLTALVALQREILDGAAALVPPGGSLLYATCSLEAEENEDQVDAFLSRHADFVLEPIEEVHESVRDERGRLVVRPWILGVDGAFAARLRRT